MNKEIISAMCCVMAFSFILVGILPWMFEFFIYNGELAMEYFNDKR